MWLIFIIACIVVALAALIVIYIGHKIIQKIERDDRVSEVEDEAYEQAKKISCHINCINRWSVYCESVRKSRTGRGWSCLLYERWRKGRNVKTWMAFHKST